MLKIFITDTAISSIRVEGLLSRPTEPGHHCERENLKFAHSQTAEIAERHIEEIFILEITEHWNVRWILYFYLYIAHSQTAEIAERHIEEIFRRILYLYLYFAHYRTAEIAESRTF